MNISKQKQVLLGFMHDKHYIPMRIKEIAIMLEIPKSRRAEIEKVLEEENRENSEIDDFRID